MAYIGNQPLATAVTNADISSSAAIDLSKLATSGDLSATNVTLGGYLRGPSTFTIDPAAHGDNTGTLVIAGNLQIDGTTTTVNSTTMTVDDLNITVASGAANAAAADGAGITVDGASATLLYNATPDAWSFNKNVGIGATPKTLHANVTSSLNVGSASDFQRTKDTYRSSNFYYNSSDVGTSIASGYALMYRQDVTNGVHAFTSSTASAGSADATVSLAERMRIDSNGNLLLGTSTHAGYGPLQVGSTSTSSTVVQMLAATNGYNTLQFGDATSSTGRYAGYIQYDHTNDKLLFGTNAATRATIDSTGRLDLAKGMVDTTTTVSYASSIALTLDNGAIQTVTLTGNATFTDSLNDGEAIVLMLNGGASHTVTWTAVTKWVTGSGNAAPTLTASDAIILWKIGSAVYAATAGSFA